MDGRLVRANGADLWTDSVGTAGDPAILLVNGACYQSIWWQDAFCGALASTGRYVIRFDHRDTGPSTCFDFGSSPYTISDLARDSIAILDAHGIESAHVVGASMGGMIGQALAIEHPTRVRSLTSIFSSPSCVPGTPGSGLPPPSSEVLRLGAATSTHPPITREERIEARVALSRALTGTLAPFEEGSVRELVKIELDRARDWDAQFNHGLAIGISRERTDALGQIRTPTLVVHGTDDPLLPYPHGVATAKGIPGAELLTIEGMGHELPLAAWPTVLNALERHTAAPPFGGGG